MPEDVDHSTVSSQHRQRPLAGREHLDPLRPHQQRLHVAGGEPGVAVEQDVLVVGDVARLPGELLEGVVREVGVADPVGRHRDAERVAAHPPHLLAVGKRENTYSSAARWATSSGSPGLHRRDHRLHAAGGLLEDGPRLGMVAADRKRAADVDVVAVLHAAASTYMTSPASTGRRDGGEWVRHHTSGPAETIVRIAGSSPPCAAITEFRWAAISSSVRPGRTYSASESTAASTICRRAPHALQLRLRLDQPHPVDDPVAGHHVARRSPRSPPRSRRPAAPPAMRPALDADRRATTSRAPVRRRGARSIAVA